MNNNTQETPESMHVGGLHTQDILDDFDDRFQKLLGGYCWHQDGGNGGYDYDDVKAFIFSKFALQEERHNEEMREVLEEVEEYVQLLTPFGIGIPQDPLVSKFAIINFINNKIQNLT